MKSLRRMITMTIMTMTIMAMTIMIMSTALSMRNIITTKRNNTITAPTYTSTRVMDRNSACKSIHTPEAWKKASTRNSAA